MAWSTALGQMAALRGSCVCVQGAVLGPADLGCPHTCGARGGNIPGLDLHLHLSPRPQQITGAGLLQICLLADEGSLLGEACRPTAKLLPKTQQRK